MGRFGAPMLDSWDPGKIAMFVSWAATALTGYVALSGAPSRGAHGVALLLALAALSAIAAWIAADRGFRVGDGTVTALLLGVFAGIGRKAAHAGASAVSRERDDAEDRP